VEQLQALCEIPTLGALVLNTVGGECPGVASFPVPNLTTLTPALICSIPELGEPLAWALGSDCEDNLSDLISPGLLCAVPLIGPLIVEALNETCLIPNLVGDPDVLLCQVAPIKPITQSICPLPEPELLCIVPVLGEALVEPFLGRCPDTKQGLFLPAVQL
jgi:hypothetical protein